MTLDTLLDYCAQHGISLRLDDFGQLKVAGNKQALAHDVVGALRQHKASIVSRLQASDQVPVALAWMDDTNAPTSSIQRQLLAMDQRHGESLRNHLVVSYDVDTGYCPTHCRASLRALLEGHVVLRSLFIQCNGESVQRATRAYVLPLVESDAEIDAAGVALVTNEVESFTLRDFDLTTELPFRLMIHRAGQSRHRLTWVFHHVAVDGQSIARILQDYSRFDANAVEAASPTLLQYRDYAAWEQRRDGMQSAPGLTYWIELLMNAKASRFPSGDATDAHADCIEKCTLPMVDVQRLGALAHQWKTSLHGLMEALFAWHLACHLDEKSVLYGTPVTLRSLPGLQDVVGPLVNTQLRYFEFSPEDRFDEFVARCTNVIRTGLCHPAVTQDAIADASGNPALRNVEAFFTLQTANARSGDCDLSFNNTIAVPRIPPKFSYTINALESEDELLLRFEWDPVRVASSFVRGQAKRFTSLIEVVLAASSITLRDTQAHLSRSALVRGPSTQHDGADLMQMFGRSVRAHGDRIAIEQGSFALTYRELDALSARWSTALRQRLTGFANRTVVVAMTRCPDFFVAQLAVVRAGATFVPVDVSLPPSRIADIIDRSHAALVLVGDRSDCSLHPLALDVERLTETTESPVPIAESHDVPAYMIFTSGTTGRPKGVRLNHEGLANLAASQARIFDIGPDDRVLQFSALGFDAQISEWSTAWSRGAALVLPSTPEQRTDVVELVRFLHQTRITHATLPPSILAGIEDPDDLPLRVLIAAGEACPQDLADHFARKRCFINAYGPTETTVCATVHLHSPGTPISIGHPIDNVMAFVADANHHALPIGAEGELCVGGLGVAIGYHSDDAQTMSRFPILAPDGELARYYMTGDRVRREPDGRFVFVGRIDEEVKIRGNRVAPEEVAHHLLVDSRVASACCIVDPARQGLLAAVVLREAVEPSDLRRDLIERLPRYMIPGRIVALKALPLTGNGKVDKVALASLIESHVSAESDLPDDPLAHVLADVWASLLDTRSIGLHSDFFELGGHSLLAARLKHAVASRLGATIDADSVFTHFLFGDFLEHVRTRLSPVSDVEQLEELEW